MTLHCSAHIFDGHETTAHALNTIQTLIYGFLVGVAGDADPLPVQRGDLDAQGEDGGRRAVPGHEVRQPDAAAHHAAADGAGARDLAPHPPVHQHGAAAARRRRRPHDAARPPRRRQPPLEMIACVESMFISF
jgi:hypothetical protein